VAIPEYAKAIEAIRQKVGNIGDETEDVSPRATTSRVNSLAPTIFLNKAHTWKKPVRRRRNIPVFLEPRRDLDQDVPIPCREATVD
jgi:hypothetical protein